MKQKNQEIITDEMGHRIAMRVSTVSIVVNAVLSLFKLAAGLIGHSGAMISDAVHSMSDVFSTIVVMIGITVSKKQSDRDHQYGHERMECVAAILLSVILFAVGIGIGFDGVQKILGREGRTIVIPGTIALIAAIVSILSKEWMFHYTKRAANKIHSGALMADAWHHRSDALSSIGALIGIGGARLGFPLLDSIASLVICFFIGKAALDIFKDAIDKMVDKSCDEETLEEMKQIISRQSGVARIDMLQTRLFGAKIYVDIEVAADGGLSLEDGHEIAQTVHDAVEEHFPLVKHCMVHINPL